jgi:hypothetical protein
MLVPIACEADGLRMTGWLAGGGDRAGSATGCWSRTPPTGGVGRWRSTCWRSPRRAEASPGHRPFLADVPPAYRLERTNPFPSGSRNVAKVPHGSFFGGESNATPRLLSWS